MTTRARGKRMAGAGKAAARRAKGTVREPSGGRATGDDILDMGQAIDLLKTTRPTFYRWLRAGRIKGMKAGRQWRFYRRDIERFMKGQEPRIDLPADIDPLINELGSRLKHLGAKQDVRPDADKTSEAVYLMIRLATAMGASDLHIEPQEDLVRVRLRVDGVLHPGCRFDRRLLPAIIERWKTLAAMDVREKTLPQDGRIIITDDGKSSDLRVCCVPAYLGESLTGRLLHADNVQLDLDRLPYAAHDRRRLDRWLAAPWGIILVTGPTGCGKTTTVYCCLAKLANAQTKVVSIEDPVEYVLPGVTQIQTNPKAGLSFERAVRAVLRSAPNVILVGETRSAESMQLCFQAALTGHLVITTLHTLEAAGALRRLLDMGCESFLVGDACKLVLAQRLVRTLCPECSAEAAPSPEQLAQAEQIARTGGVGWDALPRKYRQPGGCAHCGRLGFRGRTLIAETLEVTPEIAAALRRNAPTEEIRAIAVGQGMTTLAADGVRRAAAGQTTLTEVMRVAAPR